MKINEMSSTEAAQALEDVRHRWSEVSARKAELRGPRREQGVPVGRSVDPLHGAGSAYVEAVESGDGAAVLAVKQERRELDAELEALDIRRRALESRIKAAERAEAGLAAPKRIKRLLKDLPALVTAAEKALTAAEKARAEAQAALIELRDARRLVGDGADGVSADVLAAWWRVRHGVDGTGRLDVLGRAVDGSTAPKGAAVRDVLEVGAIPPKAVEALEAAGDRSARLTIAREIVYAIANPGEGSLKPGDLAEAAVARLTPRRGRPAARARVGSWLSA